MGVSKIVLNNELLLDLTGDTVTPEDVREGVIFHGADGEAKTGTMSPGVDVSGADAAAGDVLSGKKFVGANGALETGTMTNRGAVSQTLDGTTKTYIVPAGYHNGGGSVSVQTQTKSVTPSASAQTVTPSSGYLLSSVSVGAAKLYATGTVTGSLSTATMSINTGVTLKESDIFILMPDTSITDENPLPSGSWIVCAMRTSASSFRIGIARNSGLGWYQEGNLSISYSGYNVSVNGGYYYFRSGIVYRWVLLR